MHDIDMVLIPAGMSYWITHHHYVPSVVNRSAVMDLHRSRSCATLIQSLYDIFVHSLILSAHIVLGLPRPLLPLILPSISNRCTPSPLNICPKYWHFLHHCITNALITVVWRHGLYTEFVVASCSQHVYKSNFKVFWDPASDIWSNLYTVKLLNSGVHEQAQNLWLSKLHAPMSPQ